MPNTDTPNDQSPDSNNQTPSEKKPWTKPTITVLRSGLLNKFGKARQAEWTDSIDDVLIRQH